MDIDEMDLRIELGDINDLLKLRKIPFSVTGIDVDITEISGDNIMVRVRGEMIE